MPFYLLLGKMLVKRKTWNKLIKENNLNNNVFFVGEVLGQDKIDFLANADIFVSPSHDENFGNVYIESLAAGTPIVASKIHLGRKWRKRIVVNG